jgi:phosphoesterase RecJ-like protein
MIAMSDLIEKGKSTLPSLIQTKVENAQRIAIFGHSHIDGDAIGAMFGLGLQLEKLGKAVSYFSPDMPGRVFDFLDVSKLQTHFDYGSYDVLIFTDFTGLKRIKTFTEGYEKYFNEVEKVIIDHHLSEGEMPNAIVYRDETAISTCELVYELTNERRGEKKLIDSQIATFLYTGMLTDSGNLRYDEGKETERLLTTLLAVFRC